MIEMTIHLNVDGTLKSVEGAGLVPGQRLLIKITRPSYEDVEVEVVRMGDKIVQIGAN